MNFKKSFGANLKLLRKSRGLTQEKLSEMIDIHLRQMSKIENGEHFPSAKSLEKLSIKLGVKPQVLFDFDFDPDETNLDTPNETPSDTIKYNENLFILINKVKKISQSKEKIEFLKLAISALDDKKSLDELYLIVSGMKLTSK